MKNTQVLVDIIKDQLNLEKFDGLKFESTSHHLTVTFGKATVHVKVEGAPLVDVSDSKIIIMWETPYTLSAEDGSSSGIYHETELVATTYLMAALVIISILETNK